MKLLQILYPGLGGHSSVAFSLIEGDSENVAEHSLLGYGIEEPSEMLVAKTAELNVPFVAVKKKNGFAWTSQREVYRYLKKYRPDAIIMHSTSLIFVLFFYALFHQVKWMAVEHQSNHAKTKLDWIYTFFILMLAPKVVYLTNDYQREIKEKFPWIFQDRKTFVIPNGINTAKFKPAEKNKTDGQWVFSMISRLTPLRDHKTLLTAFSEILKSYPAKLYIAGDGTTLPDLKALTKELNIQDAVAFTGVLNEEEVIALLQQTDIYIHSSLAENLSTSLLQAMACKVPIIATDIQGINNLLKDETDALLFEVSSSQDLVKKIYKLTEDFELCRTLTLNSYAKVLRSFTYKTTFSNYFQILIHGKIIL